MATEKPQYRLLDAQVILEAAQSLAAADPPSDWAVYRIEFRVKREEAPTRHVDVDDIAVWRNGALLGWIGTPRE